MIINVTHKHHQGQYLQQKQLDEGQLNSPFHVMARLNTATGHKVVLLHQQGLSQTKVSKQTGVLCCSSSFEAQRNGQRCSGRPRKLAADERHVKLIGRCAIRLELTETSGSQVHPSTVWRSLARISLHGRVAGKKPYLRRGNEAKRLQCARKQRNWGADKRQQALWTDE